MSDRPTNEEDIERAIDEVRVDDQAHALLTALYATAVDAAASTKALSPAWVALMSELGINHMVFRSAPWWGTSEAARTLEALGIIEIDPGMASYVAPGRPAPTADMYFLVLTELGTAIQDSTCWNRHGGGETQD